MDIMLKLLPYIASTIAIIRFVIDEYRRYRKKKSERLEQLESTQKEVAQLPPRSERHKR